MELIAAIYHGDSQRLEWLEKAATAICAKNHVRLQVQSFSDQEDYCRVASRGKVNLLVMQGDEAGLRMGKSIRAQNRQAVLIYIDCSMELVLDAFERLPIAYIPAGASLYDYAKAFHSGWKWLGMQSKSVFSYRTKQQNVTIPLEEIEYFESNYRQVIIHLRSGEERIFLGKLDETEQQLDSGLFFRCHQSYLINLRYVRSIDRVNRRIVFESGKVTYVSKAHYHALMRRMEMGGIVLDGTW